jgi:two-component system, LytTR family, response regulator
MKLKAVIIDDESRGITALTRMIEDFYPEIDVAGSTTNIKDGAVLIRQICPDVVFLDVQMPAGSGFDLLDEFPEPSFSTVFVTAHSDYAIKAIKTAALDYLLKPVRPDDLKNAVERLKKKQFPRSNEQYTLLKESLIKQKPMERLMLSTQDGYYPVKIDEIIYCQAVNAYTDFHLCTGKNYMVSHNLKEYEDLLSDNGFFRIHKSFLVNLSCIEYISRTDGLTVRLINKQELPVSIRRKEEFLGRMRAL